MTVDLLLQLDLRGHSLLDVRLSCDRWGSESDRWLSIRS